LETKRRIYKSPLGPVLTCSVEAGADTSKKLLETTEMNTPRKRVGKTRFDFVTNKDIKQQCGIQPTAERILKRQEKWFNHISRKTEDRIVSFFFR
jgi:hypothetical protein